jgi:hypothetical protein
MKMIFGITLYALLPTFLFAQGPDTLWTRTYGGPSDEDGYSVCQTYDGGYIVAGHTSISNRFHWDVYLVRTDENGDTLWTKTYGGAGDEYGRSVQETNDKGFIITGTTNSYGAGIWDVYLIKTDSLGDTLWTKTYGGMYSEFGLSVQQTSDKGYIISGKADPYGMVIEDYVYLIKVDSLGDTLWTKMYGNSIDDYGGWSVQQTIDGGYIIAGYVDLATSGFPDIYVLKTDSLGDSLWARTYGDSLSDEGYAVRQTGDGGYIIAGATMSYALHGYDYILIKTDSLGNVLWRKVYGGDIYDIGRSVQETADGGYIIVGYSDSFHGLLNYDAYVVKTDSLGDTLWTRVYGGFASEYIYSVQQTSDEGYVIAGFTFSFGAGLADVYLIRIAPDTFAVEENSKRHSESHFLEVFPNPGSELVNISFGKVQNAERMELKIYNSAGELVRQFDYPTSERSGCVTWRGEDDTGKKLPSGVYFLKLNVISSNKDGDYQEVKKIILLK